MYSKIIGSIFLGMSCLFGKEIVVDSPKQITPEWEARVLGIKYGVTTLDNAVDEMVDGIINDSFGKDFISRIKAEVEKHPAGVGEYTEYWPNGSLKARLPYKDGKAHGHMHGWFENGKDAFKGHFNKGVKQGFHVTFLKKKSHERTRPVRILTYSEKGLLNTDQKTYHSDGGLWIVLPYKNGIAHGPLEGWDFKGEYFLSAQYKKGILQKKPPLPPERRPYPKLSIDEKYVDEVTNEFIKIAKKEFGVTPYITSALMLSDVEKISVGFNICKKGSIEEARTLMVKLKERFLEVINGHEKLRPYLREHPCTSYRANVRLRFCNKYGKKHEDGSVVFIFLGGDDKIYYCGSKPKVPQFIDLYSEPYKEAVKNCS